MDHKCSCAGPGKCSFFGRDMDPREYQICSRTGAPIADDARQDYLNFWAGHDPAVPSKVVEAGLQIRIVPPPADLGLGDRVKKALDTVGITQARVGAWLGEGACASCADRQEKLNALGRWAAGVGKAGKAKAKAVLETLLGT